MGNLFGHVQSNGINLYFHPDVTPHPLKDPLNEPLEGFTSGRQTRSKNVKATKEDCMSAKIPLKDRDYCVDYLLTYRACRKDNWPFPVFCEHEKHQYLNCQYEDFILRMKEYERERRLMVRAKRISEKQQEIEIIA